MRAWLSNTIVIAVVVGLASSGCSDSSCETNGANTGTGDVGGGGGGGDGGGGGAALGELGHVWLAQTHVQRVGGQPELVFAKDALNRQLKREAAPMLKLVGSKATLLKIDVPSAILPSAGLAMTARVRDAAGVQLWSGPLDAPTKQPSRFPSGPGELVHDVASSYTVIIPAEAVVPGMRLDIDYVAGDRKGNVTLSIEVGAPTVLRTTMFDFDYFKTRGDRILATAVVDELGWKLPVREYRVQRVNTPIKRAAIAPNEQVVAGVTHRTPWISATSFEDWAAKAQAATGVAWPAQNGRSVDHSQMLLGALQAAGGQAYIVGMHGNFNDGTSGNFKGRGGSNMLSSSTSANVLNAVNIFAHEISHTYDLWHWHESAGANYPYKGVMFGIADTANGTHCGPVWRWRSPAFGDGPKGAFVAPYLTATDGGRRYRRVISTSNSRDDRATEFKEFVGTYSDWDTRVAQEWFESVVRVWNADLGAWATWDNDAKSYTRRVRGTAGLDLPLVREPQSVYSIVAAVSTSAASANLVYDPVGPYDSGLLRRFDPRNPVDVGAAAALPGYCPAKGCDYSVRVLQGGIERVYLLRSDDSADVTDAKADEALKHVAINVPASDGAIQRIELLATPDVQTLGMPATPRVLNVWIP